LIKNPSGEVQIVQKKMVRYRREHYNSTTVRSLAGALVKVIIRSGWNMYYLSG